VGQFWVSRFVRENFACFFFLGFHISRGGGEMQISIKKEGNKKENY
jgi:hypothetical protein